jgi:hypothetical protein
MVLRGGLETGASAAFDDPPVVSAPVMAAAAVAFTNWRRVFEEIMGNCGLRIAD